MHRLIRILAFVFVQALLVLVLLEVASRSLDPLGISYYPETARLFDHLIREEPIGYRLPPGISGRFHGVPVEINSLGMRDREVPTQKSPGEIRVLLMGDSVPFGVGVLFEDSIPAQLEKHLNQRADGLSYRVLNMGVPSYNTEQQLIQLREIGLDLKPDVAVLLFSRNDIEPKDWVFAKRANWTADLAQRSHAVSLLFVGARALRQRVGQRADRDADQGTTRINLGAYQPNHPRWLAIERSLAGMMEEFDPRGIPFLVLARGPDEEMSHFQLLQSASKRYGFHLVMWDNNVDPRWEAENARRYVNSVVDAHCNALGCSIAATAIEHAMRTIRCDQGGCRFSPGR